jgi:hypothetical protein
MAKPKFTKDVTRVYEKILDTFTDEKMDVTLCATIDMLITVSDAMELDFLDVLNHLIERKKQFNEVTK